MRLTQQTCKPGTLRGCSISQVALIVGDLERTMRGYHDMLGWGPWRLYEYREPWLQSLKASGRPAYFTWLGAETRVGSVWFELLQPLDGVGPLAEWHRRHGDGFHHIGYEVATMEESARLRRAFSESGARELVSAWCGNVYFYYMDTEPLITEVWVGSAAELEPIRVFPNRRDRHIATRWHNELNTVIDHLGPAARRLEGRLQAVSPPLDEQIEWRDPRIGQPKPSDVKRTADHEG
jgi:methylmalonyl-CoA/ethylmalonyl-CoA epimerase